MRGEGFCLARKGLGKEEVNITAEADPLARGQGRLVSRSTGGGSGSSCSCSLARAFTAVVEVGEEERPEQGVVNEGLDD